MDALHQYLNSSLWTSVLVLAAAFAVLARSAGLFVDGAVGVAYRLRIPELAIGIVLVSLATTAPELAVSLTAAVQGSPEIALGNAVGSVICNGGLALALAGLAAPAAILVMPRLLLTSGLFLVVSSCILFVFVCADTTLSRWEGAVLVGVLLVYLATLYRQHRRGELKEEIAADELARARVLSPLRLALYFLAGLAGVVVASEFIVHAAQSIARACSIPESLISLTLIALGTSIPEIATCITAARRGHGALAVGNIVGANIMNICWVAGASALANDLTLGPKEVFFMFPAMFVVVGVMLLLLRAGYSLTRPKALILMILYAAYLAASIILFPPGTAPA